MKVFKMNSYYSTVLEIKKNEIPNWETAKEFILHLTEEECALIVNNTIGYGFDDEDIIEAIKHAMKIDSVSRLFIEALIACKAIWEDDFSLITWDECFQATCAELYFTKALICAGYGDNMNGDAPPGGYYHIELFRNCGAAKAAGFLV